MQKNPYKFTGPLDPNENKLVCIHRQKEIDQVITGILDGDYWTILGPRQIGKTTFMRQIKNNLSDLKISCISIDLEVSPKSDEAFYEWIKSTILKDFARKSSSAADDKRKDFGYELKFYNFLETFLPDKSKKFVLLFDEIEKPPSLNSFLKIWRKVYHDRVDQPELKKYSLVIAGSVDLVPLTIGPTSPFNIARKLYLSNLTDDESKRLIVEPFKEHGIEIESKVVDKIISQTCGHPQLIQHICYLLFEKAINEEKGITIDDIDEAIDRLYIYNDNLKTLKKQINDDRSLEDLLKRILKGEKIEYANHQHLSLAGTGSIIRQDNYCTIRNKIYEGFLTKVLCIPSPVNDEKVDTPEYVTSISLKEKFDELSISEKDEAFFKCLFDPDSVEIKIAKKSDTSKQINLNQTETRIFCYLAYQNYKACKEGFSPSSSKYRLSSVPSKNSCHGPEWNIFVEAMGGKISTDVYESDSDQNIRSGILSIRKKLIKEINADDLVPKQESGGGKGYWLKGSVIFC